MNNGNANPDRNASDIGNLMSAYSALCLAKAMIAASTKYVELLGDTGGVNHRIAVLPRLEKISTLTESACEDLVERTTVLFALLNKEIAAVARSSPTPAESTVDSRD